MKYSNLILMGLRRIIATKALEEAKKLKRSDFFMHMDNGKEIIAGSEMHQYMCLLSQEAIRLTTELNNSYHTSEEIVSLMSRITGQQIDDSFIQIAGRI